MPTPAPAGASRLVVPALRWSGGTLVLAATLDDLKAYPTPRPGNVRVRFPSGEVDGWSRGVDWYLEGWVDYLPAETQLIHGVPVTGWEGVNGAPTGWRAALESAWAGASMTWLPDATTTAGALGVELLRPSAGDLPELEDDGTRRLFLRLRSLGRRPFLGY